MASPTILIIIPVLNDAVALESSLDHLLKFWDARDIMVVDGGSADKSMEIARKKGVRTRVSKQPGRAVQMNLGAENTLHDVLLFLHADTRLPFTSASLIRKAVNEGCIGGAFSRRYDTPSAFLRFTCRLADWRGRRFGLFLGDQAIFTRRDYFGDSGGIPALPLFEDLEFSRKMATKGKTCLLSPPVISSARRFKKRGPVRQTLRDLSLTLHYFMTGPHQNRHDEKMEKNPEVDSSYSRNSSLAAVPDMKTATESEPGSR